MKVIYQDRLMNLNYKYLPCHGAVICNCCRNCLTVQSRDPFRGIIPNNINLKIEIVHNQRMLADNERAHVTVKVRLLLSIIFQDYINLNGPDNGGNR